MLRSIRRHKGDFGKNGFLNSFMLRIDDGFPNPYLGLLAYRIKARRNSGIGTC